MGDLDLYQTSKEPDWDKSDPRIQLYTKYEVIVIVKINVSPILRSRRSGTKWRVLVSLSALRFKFRIPNVMQWNLNLKKF